MGEERTNRISVVLAADDNYAQHAAVAMASVLANTAVPEQVAFWLIDDGISSRNKDKVRQTVARWHSRVSFLTIKNKELEQGFVSGPISRTAYFRLDIPDIVPADVERVIYLDCDLLVLDDILLPLADGLGGKSPGRGGGSGYPHVGREKAEQNGGLRLEGRRFLFQFRRLGDRCGAVARPGLRETAAGPVGEEPVPPS